MSCIKSHSINLRRYQSTVRLQDAFNNNYRTKSVLKESLRSGPGFVLHVTLLEHIYFSIGKKVRLTDVMY
jgi:hypothetical protein